MGGEKMNRKIATVYVSIIVLTTVFVVFSDPSFAAPSGWSSDVRLTNDDSTSYWPDVVVNGNNIHVVWHDHRDGNYEIYYKTSTDNGESWSSDIRLTNGGSNSQYPAVAVNGNNIHVVWHDNIDGNREIYYKTSTDNGESWSNDIRLTNGGSNYYWPAVAVNGNNIHVVWTHDYYEIYYKRSTDNGENWSSDVRLTEGDSYSEYPAVAVNGNNIHVVWYDHRDGNWEIYYKTSTDNGGNWSSDVRLTNDDAYSYWPAVAVNGNNIHVVWHDDRDGNYEVYYKTSTDNGENWGSDIRLTNDGSVSEHPTIAVNGNNIHVVWHDDRDGNYEIYYKTSTDNGGNWSSDVRLTNDGSTSYWPDVVVNGNNIHIVWHDDRDENWEIYYKQILNQKTIAILFASATNVTKGKSITFNASASVGKELVYSFDFGDGATSDWGYDAVKTHKYSEEGTYTAKVKVRDMYGEESLWFSIEITVGNPKSDENANGIPGFELILILCVITTILFWKRKKQV
jgi:hypothetical protein